MTTRTAPRARPASSSTRSLRARAFTLLEVMVAVAVLAVGVVVLLQSQARSILMAQQARTLTVATMLARGKLLDCEADFMKKGFSVGDYKETGKFDDEGYPQFLWECHGYKPDLPMPEAADFTEAPSASDLGTGSDPLSGAATADPTGGMAMGMMGPVLGQISQVVGDSIRELAVIVRWQEGSVWDSIIVTTHIVDTSGVNAIAQQMSALSGGIPGLPGAGGSGRDTGGGSATPDPTRGGSTVPPGTYPPGVSPTPPPFQFRDGR